MRGLNHGIARVAFDESFTDFARELGVALLIVCGLAVFEHVARGIDAAPAGIKALTVVVDGIAERIERASHGEIDLRIERQKLREKFEDTLGLREFVVADDVTRLANVFEEVVDERLGLE